jgi:hypothetical protein
MKLINTHYVFSTLVRFAGHAVTDEAIAEFEKFAKNDSTSYSFTNADGETYTLTARPNQEIPFLTYPANDYSGNPAVTSLVNGYFMRVNEAPRN